MQVHVATTGRSRAIAGRLLDFDGDTKALRRFAACFQPGGAL